MKNYSNINQENPEATLFILGYSVANVKRFAKKIISRFKDEGNLKY